MHLHGKMQVRTTFVNSDVAVIKDSAENGCVRTSGELDAVNKGTSFSALRTSVR